jgi:hypothetical protein
MATDAFDNTAASELLVSHQDTVKIEEVAGRKIARFSVPPLMQGHTFAVDLSDSTPDSTPTGPFRIEYVLGTEFVIHEDELPSFRFEDGYSHLVMAPELARLEVTLQYVDTNSPGVLKEATLTFRGSEAIVQRLIVETPEVDLANAVRHTGQIVADLLDAVSFVKRVPISIRHIEVHAIGKRYQRRYVTLPYGSRQLTADNLTEATTVPLRLKAALRLFRESLNSSKPHYRLLCLYRVREVVESVRRENDQDILARGMKPDRPSQVLPDNELTRCYFPTYIGKKVGAFLDHVRTAYRLAVAHGNLDEYFKLVLDPANVRVDHRIDFTNAVLMSVVAEMIQDERDLMIRHGLSGSLLLAKGNAETAEQKV